MNANQTTPGSHLQNECTRAEAIKSGQLFDISHSTPSLGAVFTVPAAISKTLWNAMMGETPFSVDHPHLLLLCRLVFARMVSGQVARRREGFFSESVWLTVSIAQRAVIVKAVCHPGDTADAVFTLLEGSESTALEL